MNIFVSYRRSDSKDAAGRLVDRLMATPGIDQVFYDVQSIVAGEIFADRIIDAIEHSDVVIVIIGEQWLGPNGVNNRRLENEDDFVRREILSALESQKRVIPLLINDASMPKRDSLPEPLTPICSLNAPRLRHESFKQDVTSLTQQILGTAETTDEVKQGKQKGTINKFIRAARGLLVSSFLLVVFAFIHKLLLGVPVAQTIGRDPMIFIIFISLLSGALIPLKFGKKD